MGRERLISVVPRYEGKIAGPAGSAVPKSGRFISLTNSERSLAACPKRWWFRHGERLDTEAGPAARLGTAFHEVMEDVWGWWAETEDPYPTHFIDDACIWCHRLRANAPTWAEESDCVCERCSEGDAGAVPTMWHIAKRWRDTLVDCDEPFMTEDELAEQVERLRNMLIGYLTYWGTKPPDGYRVIGVEVTLAAPIMDGEREYRTNVPVVHDGREIRVASRADLRAGLTPKMVRWPWYQVGRVDGLLQHKETGSLWILEHKTTHSPQTYFKALSLDPQTTGYVWMLESMCRRGLFGPELENHPNPVAGYMYDVVSSSVHRSPTLLKNGELSRAKAKNIPSWLYRKAIEEHGLDAAEYDDAVQHCADTIDKKLYQREFGRPGQREIERYCAEMVGIAERHALMRRNLVNGSDQDRKFPRTPACMRGFCSYKGICVNDTPEGRAHYVEGRVQHWSKPGVEKPTDEGTTETQADELPF